MSEMNPLSFFEEDVTEEINHGIRVSNLAYWPWRRSWDCMKNSVMNWLWPV